MMPNLEAQYAARRAPPFLPHWENMLMMRPRTPRASIERATACEVMKVPLRLVSSTVSHDSSGRSTTSVRSRLPGAPALLTRMSMRPNSSSARATTFAISEADRTSAISVITRRPRLRISSATASIPPQAPGFNADDTRNPVGVTSVRTRSAPSSANRRAIARPSPCSPPAPVTIATLLSSRPIVVVSSSSVARARRLGRREALRSERSERRARLAPNDLLGHQAAEQRPERDPAVSRDHPAVDEAGNPSRDGMAIAGHRPHAHPSVDDLQASRRWEHARRALEQLRGRRRQIPGRIRSRGHRVEVLGAARRRRRQQAADQSRRVEPRVGGVERDLLHVIRDGQAGLQGRRALSTDRVGGVAAARKPVDALAKLALLVFGLGPLERAAIVIAGIAAELTRELAMGGHPRGVESMVDVRLLPDRVQPGEGRAARTAAGRPGVERQHARSRPRGGVGRGGAHDAEPDYGYVVVLHRRPPGATILERRSARESSRRATRRPA